jgi:hypothetical protein
MDDEEVELVNFCSDLVSLQPLESFPRNLLAQRASGEWAVVDELCRQSSVPVSSAHPNLFATWLPDPAANEAYVVILFFDDESKWTLAANYHRQRLERTTDDVRKAAALLVKKAEATGQASAKQTILAQQVLQEVHSGGPASKTIQLDKDDAARMASDQ